MKRTKIIVIDAENKRLVPGSVSSLEDMQAIVGGLIQECSRLPNGDIVIADEEGLFKRYTFGFQAYGQPQFLLGNGFIIGAADDKGEYTDAATSLQAAAMVILFSSVTDEEE